MRQPLERNGREQAHVLTELPGNGAGMLTLFQPGRHDQTAQMLTSSHSRPGFIDGFLELRSNLAPKTIVYGASCRAVV